MSTHEELDKAITAHAAWKGKFRSFMKDELDLDPTVVEKCNVCDFGKWLDGSGRAALGASHAEVHKAHAEFHAVAAMVVRQKKAGDAAGAEASLGPFGEFGKATSALTLLVVAIRNAEAA
jgi:endogenous inhibitor of DNA gyrase (YacG/DUF329 family)